MVRFCVAAPDAYSASATYHAQIHNGRLELSYLSPPHPLAVPILLVLAVPEADCCFRSICDSAGSSSPLTPFSCFCRWSGCLRTSCCSSGGCVGGRSDGYSGWCWWFSAAGIYLHSVLPRTPHQILTDSLHGRSSLPRPSLATIFPLVSVVNGPETHFR